MILPASRNVYAANVVFLTLLIGCLTAQGVGCKVDAATVRTQSAEQTSYSRLHQIGIALLEYVSDNDNRFPPMTSDIALQAALEPYFRGEPNVGKLYVQPGSEKPYLLNKELSGVQLNPGASWVLLMSDSVPAADGSRMTLFGRMQISPANEVNPPEFLYFKVERMSKPKFRSLLSTKIQTVSH